MKPQPDYTVEDLMQDFIDSSSIYVNRAVGNTYLRMQIITDRPLQWLLLLKVGTVRQRRFWIQRKAHLVKAAHVLLTASNITPEVQLKLRLIMNYAEASTAEEATAQAEKFSLLRKWESGDVTAD